MKMTRRTGAAGATALLLGLLMLSLPESAMAGDPGWRPVYDVAMRWVNFLILVAVIVKYGREPIKEFLKQKKEETMAQIEADCQRFQTENEADLQKAYKLYKIAGNWTVEEQAGHDFWLTRNGEGAGFWDRGLGDVGEDLTKACRKYKSCYLYIGDDKRLYV